MVWMVIFMKKLIYRTGICLLVALAVWGGTLLADRKRLNEELIRLHVVANSDRPEDQSIKLQVRDAVIQSLEEDLKNVGDVALAKQYLTENLPKIQAVANDVLEKAGVSEEAVVSLCRETFDTRYYDTFTLPAGVYEALRITIGEGKGHNWWCVVFPTLCVPATTEGFADTAAGAGFPEPLTGALTGEEEYEIRFYILDALGRVENYFFPD